MPQVRKRRKISLVMSPAEYDAAQEESKQEDVDMDKSDAQVKDIIDQLKKKEPVALGDKGA